MNGNRGEPYVLARVKARCTEQGITINKLETISGLSKGSIRKWDAFSPTTLSLRKVARALGTTCSDLLGEDDPEERERAQKELVDSIQYLSIRQIRRMLDLVRESRSL